MLDRRWRERQLCVVAEAGDQLLGYGWLCQRMAMLDMGLAKTDAPDIFLSERVVAPTPAVPGLDEALERAMLRLAREQGATRAFRILEAEKHHGLDAATAAGWTVTGTAFLLRGWRSNRPRLWLTLGNVYPLQLLQALEDEADAEPVMPLATLVRRTLARPFQWLRHGVFHLQLLRLGTWLLSWFGHARLIFVCRRDLAKPIPHWEARVPITISRAVPDDAAEIAALDPEDDEDCVALYRNRLERGEHCFIARIDRRMVACNWIRLKAAFSFTDIRVADDEIYMTDGYTIPEYRGQRIHPAMNAAMLRYAREQGYKASYSILMARNSNSWITMPRVGWEISGVVLSFEPKGGRERFWCLKGRPYPMLLDQPADRSRPDAALGSAD
jgi:ribosomal protein S18 acetylase RimI-like enzyme